MATIIKATSESPQPSGQDVRQVAFNFSDMSHQANSYLDEVRSQAAGIIADAKQEAETT